MGNGQWFGGKCFGGKWAMIFSPKGLEMMTQKMGGNGRCPCGRALSVRGIQT